ncbi:Phage integrase family protein [Tritonibacter multivorans]|uniref:Phage integrase family protein n=1 Tax=Tritonibacter multivorans TaxID=928856 RepID=A0A0P1G0L2_9RHOB|nr:Phage integrase family protein [Tritonibacter multivorans]SFC87296.1 Phage integrase family protein [Tritonibacter multivorans]
MRRPRPCLHLERRPSSFYWRRRVPEFFSKNASNRFFVFSLKTDVVREAEVLARRLTWLSSLAFDYSRGVANMETGLMERVLTELVRFEIAASDYARTIAPERTREEAQQALQREHALQATLRDALLLRNRDAAKEPVRAAAARLGVQVSEDNSDWVALAYEATRVLLDLSVERSQRDQGVFSAPSRFFEAAMKADAAPSMPAYRAEPSAIAVHAAPVAHMVAEPATATTSAPVSAPLNASEPIQPSPPKATKKASIKLSEAFARYGETRLEGKLGKEVDEVAVPAKGESYERNSFANLRSTARLLVDVIGDKDVSELKKSDFTDAFSVIQRAPTNHGKSPTETRSTREIIAAIDLEEQKNKARVHAQLKKAGASQGNIEAAEHQESIARLRVNTVYRHMQDTQRVLRYMIAHGYLTENFMKGVIWSKQELQRLEILQEDNSRKIWGDELPKLFRTPVFQGAITDIGDPMFWSPLISSHQGMREEEALQLRADDVASENGIDFFDIKVGAPWQRLKSKAATRRIPIHPNLIALGFLDFVAMRRREGEDRLFPHLTRGKTRKTLSENFTKDFTRYRKAHGVYDERIDFHSFRTQFNVEQIKARTDSELRHILMGHEMETVNLKHYGGDGHDLAYLQEIVQRVDIDVSMIQSPFVDSKKAKVSDLQATRKRLRVV